MLLELTSAQYAQAFTVCIFVGAENSRAMLAMILPTVTVASVKKSLAETADDDFAGPARV